MHPLDTDCTVIRIYKDHIKVAFTDDYLTPTQIT